mmetsp:Transcript_15/g.63  ORF Transcript_15/g.63 Transcript_15/m.63 type:complete len:250 (+) Transcript_15:72-821(+)
MDEKKEGNSLFSQGEFDEAITAYERGLAHLGSFVRALAPRPLLDDDGVHVGDDPTGLATFTQPQLVLVRLPREQALCRCVATTAWNAVDGTIGVRPVGSDSARTVDGTRVLLVVAPNPGDRVLQAILLLNAGKAELRLQRAHEAWQRAGLVIAALRSDDEQDGRGAIDEATRQRHLCTAHWLRGSARLALHKVAAAGRDVVAAEEAAQTDGQRRSVAQLGRAVERARAADRASARRLAKEVSKWVDSVM